MNIELAVLADYAAVTHDNKLVIAGIFDSLNVPALPWIHPTMSLALRISGDAADEGRHDLELRLVDPDGAAVIPSLKGELELPPVLPDGAPSAAQFVMGMVNVTFGSFGPHAFDILIDGRYESSATVYARHVPIPPNA